MTLKIFLFRNPISGDIEEIYEYPESFMARAYLAPKCRPVTKQPFEPPIFLVPEEYLTEAKGPVVISGDNIYVDNRYYNYWLKQNEINEDEKKFDEKLEKLKKVFGIGVFHLNDPKITFYTGPKSVFGKQFREKVIFRNDDMLHIGNLGRFSFIKNCSIKDSNALFVSGRFHTTEDEINDDTQCKISLIAS
jgi:hypothetical protein